MDLQEQMEELVEQFGPSKTILALWVALGESDADEVHLLDDAAVTLIGRKND